MTTPTRLSWAALAASLLVSLSVLASIGHAQWFFQDDAWYLSQAREQGLTWDYLSGSFFGNFAPLFKAVYWIDLVLLDRSYGLLVAAEVVLLLAVLLQLLRLMRLLTEPSALQPLLVASVALSALWTPTMLWTADGLHVLPSALATLVGLEAYVRHRQDGRRRWLVLLALAQVVGLGFWAKAALLPVLILLLRVLVLDEGRPRDLLRRLAREWPVALAVGVPCLLYVLQVSGEAYVDPNNPRDGWASLAPEVAAIGWFNGFWPGLIGIGSHSVEYAAPVGMPEVEQQSVLAALVAQGLLLIALLWCLWRRPAAWRPWVGLVLTWLVTAALITYAKPKTGTTIGREYRLLVDTAPLAALWLALALGRLRVDGAAGLKRPARGTVPPWLLRAAPALVAAGLVAHGVAFARAADSIEDPWKGKEVRAFVERLREDAARLDGPAVVQDGPVGNDVMAAGFGPYAQGASFLTLWVPELQVTAGPDAFFTFGPDTGELVPRR